VWLLLWNKNRTTAVSSLVHSPTNIHFLRRPLIEFVFIPPYSPTLNAIEPLWKSLKREISPEIYEDEEHFRQFLTEIFLRLSRRVSFAVDWIDTFLPNIQRLR
jgi:transposase